MVDEDVITSSKTESEYVEGVSTGERIYFNFEMQGLPLNGGDIYVEFYF